MFSLPNLLTLSNLLSGCIALLMLVRLDIQGALICLFLCLVFDVLDGLSARMLGMQSAIGKELDSLADMISFGLLPGQMYYIMLAASHGSGGSIWEDLHVFALPALLVPIFSALRLAKFNTDEQQTENFIGMPTPANTILAAGLLYCWADDSSFLHASLDVPGLLYTCLVASSLLLVAPIPMLSLKAKNLSWKNNQSRYILIITAIVLFAFNGLGGLPLIIFFYLLLSIVTFGFRSQTKTPNNRRL